MSATNTTRTASSPGLPALTRWCRRSVPAYLDDCGEVDVTALALDCARAHGEEMPGEHHPAWEAATAAADAWYDSKSARE